MNGPPVRLERVYGDAGELLACSCSEVPFAPGAPSASLQLAAWLRQRGSTQELCLHADGSVSFAREQGAPRTVVRAAR